MRLETPSGVLKAILHSSTELDVRLLHYPPGLIQPTHRHDETQLSVLLAGGLREITNGRDVEAVRPSSGVKPAGQSHAAQFGPHGALMLSMTLAAKAAPERKPGEWLSIGPGGIALIEQMLMTASRLHRAETAQELCAVLAGPAGEVARAGRDAARRLKRALDENPRAVCIGAVARRLGCHRAHLTRCFNATYGLAPSRYRTRVMSAQAVASALRGDHSLAAVAADVGFADQSHLARTSRRQIGVPLSRLRQLFAEATSVQAPELQSGQ